ncbi:MAG: hypothetical protein ACRELA_10860 [Candidatus Rokuibacteriota bacterium]
MPVTRGPSISRRRHPGQRIGLLALATLPLMPGVIGATGPTDIVRVDDFIGAARELFGRTGPGVERVLGAPVAVERGAVPSFLDPVRVYPARRLSYPGLVIEVLATGLVRRVQVTAPRPGLPFGLNVGTSRDEVERALGEPQEATDTLLMYLYSDGYPDTVHFHLRDGRVGRIEWNYGSAE